MDLISVALVLVARLIKYSPCKSWIRRENMKSTLAICIFVDYKAALDSQITHRVYASLSELGVPAKLILLCRITLSSTRCPIKVATDLRRTFTGQSLIFDLLNFVIEVILCRADFNGWTRYLTIYRTTRTLLTVASRMYSKLLCGRENLPKWVC